MTLLAVLKANRTLLWIIAFCVSVNIAIILLYYEPYTAVLDRRRYASPLKRRVANAAFGRPNLRHQASLSGKVILLWTGWFKDKNWDHFIDGRNGPFVWGNRATSDDCLLTSDRSLIAKADAVVFHGWDLRYSDIPKERKPSQRWIYYSMESPADSRIEGSNLKRANEIKFNWTMSYHRNSDVFSPYFYAARRNSKGDNDDADRDHRIKSFTNDFTKRPKDAFWFISRCTGPSLRLEISRLLRNHGISVDQFGLCSKTKPETLVQENGERDFYSRYRFHLSFENSLCDDYITETFEKGLRLSRDYGIIPIVYGANLEGYQRIAPNGSYIFAESFPNVAALASHLKELKTTEGMAASYYEWQKTDEIVDESLMNDQHRLGPEAFITRQLQNMCKKIFLEDKTGCRADPSGDDVIQPCQPPDSSISDLTSRLGRCRTPFLDEADY